MIGADVAVGAERDVDEAVGEQESAALLVLAGDEAGGLDEDGTAGLFGAGGEVEGVEAEGEVGAVLFGEGDGVEGEGGGVGDGSADDAEFGGDDDAVDVDGGDGDDADRGVEQRGLPEGGCVAGGG